MPTTETIEKLLNLEHVASRWDVTTRTVRNRWYEGNLRAIRIGRRLLFRMEDIRAYEEARNRKRGEIAA